MQEKFIEIDSLKLFYLEGGQGQSVLFLHGGGARARSYQEILDSLAQKYHIIAPDIPGFGNSNTPSEIWDFADYAKFFNKFLETRGINSIIVIGHSFGGGIALLLASQLSTVSRLILVGSSGIPMDVTLWRLIAPLFKKTVLQFYFDKSPKSLSIVADFFDGCRKHFSQLPKIYQTIKKSMQSLYPQISKIVVPTLLLWGKYDNLLTLDIARELNRQIKNSQLEIINGGHDWCLFEPELFVKKIEDFVQKDKKTGATKD